MTFEVRAFKRKRLLRRDHGVDRTSHQAERPDALLSGTLEVTEGDAFAALSHAGSVVIARSDSACCSCGLPDKLKRRFELETARVP
jgi:hypothetical protein